MLEWRVERCILLFVVSAADWRGGEGGMIFLSLVKMDVSDGEETDKGGDFCFWVSGGTEISDFDSLCDTGASSEMVGMVGRYLWFSCQRAFTTLLEVNGH